MKKLILVFLIIYGVFGLTNFVLFDTPNATNDFVFHYYSANGEINNPEFVEHYGSGLEDYPEFFHVLTSPFASSKLFYYLAMVFLICGIAPFLLYKLAGSFSVWVYFALSLPHMILYNSTFASFMILIYFLSYLLFKRKTWAFVLFGVLASFTHRWGLYFFMIILIAELIESLIKKYEWEKYWKLPRIAPIGILAQDKIFNFTKLISVFLNHMNIYFFYLARKSRDWFFIILIGVGLCGAVIIDFRILILSQISLAVVVANELEKQNPSKKFYIICVLLMILNFLSFAIETERFLLFN